MFFYHIYKCIGKYFPTPTRRGNKKCSIETHNDTAVGTYIYAYLSRKIAEFPRDKQKLIYIV